mmetsp:Transcript_11913/g.14404  ORF Transcript_11913/g.14404 Transcript_11913/m.14404 type:complete len:486 (-) Transcript_11913:96-1553(-)
MAAASDDSIPFPIICSIFQLPRGCPEPFNIKSALGPLNPETNDKLTALQSFREQIESLYCSTKKERMITQSDLSSLAPATEIISRMNEYWKLLKSLILSIEVDPDAVRLVESFVVEWPSPLNRHSVRIKLTTATSKHLLGALYMEACLLLCQWAYMLMENARATIGTICTRSAEFKVGADQMCRAAGIFDYVAHKVENEWAADLNSLVSLEQRPLETTPILCIGMRDICLAQAQGMAVAQTIANGNSKPSILCKLSQGIIQLMTTGIDRLSTIPTYSELTGIARKGDPHSSITQHWQFYASIWKAMSYHFAAEIEWNKDSYGIAIAYQTKAVNETKQSSVQVPFQGELSKINQIVTEWKTSEVLKLKTYSDENSTIYYQSVPSLDILDSLPSPAIIMKPVLFSDQDIIPFSLIREVIEPPPPPTYSETTTQANLTEVSGGQVSVGSSSTTTAQERIEQMGFPSEVVRAALLKHHQNEAAAIDSLL